MVDEDAVATTRGPAAGAPPVEDYRVGNCRPPLETRFSKGRSGNPRGRPKGSKNTKTLVERKLAEKVRVRSPDGRERRLSKREIGVTKLVNRFAETGDLKTFELLLKLDGDVAAGGHAPPAAHQEEEITPTGQAMLDWYVAMVTTAPETN